MKTGSRAPQSSRAGTSASSASPSATAVSGGPAGVVGLQRDVGHEVADGRPGRRAGVRRGQALRGPARAAAAGRAAAAPDEGRGADADQARAAAGDRASRISPRRGRRRVVVDGGVGQHHPGQLVPVAQRPAHRDRPAPVVGHGDHRPLDVQRPGERVRGRRSARPAAGAAAAAPTSPCPAGRPRPPASPAGRWPGTGATGRTRWGCRARRACVPADGSARVVQHMPGAVDALPVRCGHPSRPARVDPVQARCPDRASGPSARLTR